MNVIRRYGLVGSAFGLGSRRPETRLAPQAMRSAGLLKRLQALPIDLVDYGDLDEPQTLSVVGEISHLRYGEAIRVFGEQLHARVRAVVADQRIPVVIGGDHSCSVASVGAVVQGLSEQLGRPAEVGLLWVDAHSDVNTPDTTPSGNAHGMPVAALCGYGHECMTTIGGAARHIAPQNVIFVGLRDLDPEERNFIKNHGISAYTMSDIDRIGIGAVMNRALDLLSGCRDGFVVSFDLDVCDPSIAPGVGTPVRGGLSFRESHCVMEMIAESPTVRSVELVEYNPACDEQGATAEMGIALLESALGKTIL